MKILQNVHLRAYVACFMATEADLSSHKYNALMRGWKQIKITASLQPEQSVIVQGLEQNLHLPRVFKSLKSLPSINFVPPLLTQIAFSKFQMKSQLVILKCIMFSLSKR